MEEEIIVPEEETFEYNKLRYILNNEGYVCHASLGGLISCDIGECTEYNGDIPNGYETIEEWYEGEIERLNAWKIVDDNLVFDVAKYNDLQIQFNQEAENNRHLTKKDLYEIDEKIKQNDASLKEQFQKVTTNGKLVETINTKPLSPNIKITNINCYVFDKIKLIATNRNMLPNNANSKTISGITFTQNVDRSITLYGTSTDDIEYAIAGTNTSVSSIFVFKKGFNYYLSSNGYQIKMYNYNGEDREEVYSGTGGIINFDEDKPITQVVLYIPKETTINDVTIYPQIDYGIAPSEYITHQEYTLEIDFASFIENGLFPSENVFPSDSLYPTGTNVNYIRIENNSIYICKDNQEEHLQDGFLSVLEGFNYIYSIQDTNLEVTYYNNVLNVDNLDFLCGKETTNKQFKILDDASIQVNNIYMYDGAKVIGGDGLLTNLQFNSGHDFNKLGFSFNYTNGGYDKVGLYINAYIPKGFTITSAYITLYHRPINRIDGQNVARWGYARAINLYKYSTINVLDGGYSGSERIIDDSSVIDKITNVLGSNGFTPKVPSDSDYSTTSITSTNLKDDLSEGMNILKIQSDASISSTIEEEYAVADVYSCFAYATLNIIGYMNYDKEE